MFPEDDSEVEDKKIDSHVIRADNSKLLYSLVPVLVLP